MIKYTLVCEHAHDFESWFADSEGFEQQVRRGLVSCPQCNSAKVRKAVMSPSVARRDRAAAPVPAAAPVATSEPAVSTPQPMVLLDERQRALQAVVKHIHAEIMKRTDDVGPRFADEARRMHDGDVPHRSIRGQASLEEAQSLIEDGVEISPIPRLPDEWN